MKTNAPGTAARTREKSSDPVIGNGRSSYRSSPSTSRTTPAAKSTSAASLTVSGYSSP